MKVSNGGNSYTEFGCWCDSKRTVTPVDWVVWEGFLGDVTFKLRPGKQQGVNEVKLWPRAFQARAVAHAEARGRKGLGV